MKIDEWKTKYCRNGKHFSRFDNMYRSIDYINKNSREFDDKGLDRFLLVNWNEYNKYEEETEILINKFIKNDTHELLRVLNEEINKYNSKEFINIFFSYKPTKNYYIACEVAKRAYNHTILPNIFEDDTSINHMATFNKNQIYEISFMSDLIHSYGRSNNILNAYNIYGIDIGLIASLCMYGDTNILLPKELNRFCSNRLSKMDDPIKIIEVRDTIDIIMENGYFTNELELSYYLSRNIMIPINDMYKKVRFSSPDPKKHIYFTLGNKFQDEKSIVYTELVKKNKIDIKWKSEKAMFELLSENYDDAIYQYRPKWLKPQSLDVFIPSINTAFEYQGAQHYTSVDYFGGEEQLKKQKNLDLKKKKLCKENGVTLIEWEYNESITKSNLRRKLKDINLYI